MNEMKRLNIPREHFQEINGNENVVTCKRTLILSWLLNSNISRETTQTITTK